MVRRLGDQELGLWRRVARTVRPLEEREPVRVSSVSELETEFGALLTTDETPPPGSGPLGARRITPVVDRSRPVTRPGRLNANGGKPQSPPANMSGLKRVRRSRVEVTARLDLHGLTEDEAIRALTSFVIRQQAVGCRCGLVITGKGRQGAGLLKRRFVDWLSVPDIRPAVSGYSIAGHRHGGEGAYYLFFRSAK